MSIILLLNGCLSMVAKKQPFCISPAHVLEDKYSNIVINKDTCEKIILAKNYYKIIRIVGNESENNISLQLVSELEKVIINTLVIENISLTISDNIQFVRISKKNANVRHNKTNDNILNADNSPKIMRTALSDDNTVVIAVSVTISVLLIIGIAVTIFICYRNRKRQELEEKIKKRKHKHKKDHDNKDPFSEQPSVEDYNGPDYSKFFTPK